MYAFKFVCEAVVEGRVTAAAGIILKLLQWLVQGPWEAGVPSPPQQREKHFMALLNHLDFRHSKAQREAFALWI